MSSVVDVDDSAILADNKERLYFVQREDDQRLVRYEDGEIEVLDSAEFIYLCDVSSDGSTILYTKPFQDDFAMYCYEDGEISVWAENTGLARFGRDDELIARNTGVLQLGDESHVVVETMDGETIIRFGVDDDAKVFMKDWHPEEDKLLIERQGSQYDIGVYDVDVDRVSWLYSNANVEAYAFNAAGDAVAVFDNDVMNQGGVMKPKLIDTKTGEGSEVPTVDDVEVRRVIFRSADVAFDSGGFLAHGRRRGGRVDLVYFDEDGVEVLVEDEAGTASDVEPEWVVFESFDGEDVEGWLWKARDEPRPAVIYLHGGPFGRTSKYHAESIIWRLVEAGFHVLAVNYRGSTGQGQRFRELAVNDFGGDELRDTVQGAEWLRDHGLVDGGIGLYGHSFGGYEVLMHLVEHGGVWDAGVASAAPADLRGRNDLEGMFPNKEDDESFLASRSPIDQAGEIDTPLLALHGEEDLACPVEDMREFDKAVQEKASLSGEEYRFEVFEGVGHVLQGSEAEEKRDELVVEFFSEHLD